MEVAVRVEVHNSDKASAYPAPAIQRNKAMIPLESPYPL
jgi:hypothetical protein